VIGKAKGRHPILDGNMAIIFNIPLGMFAPVGVGVKVVLYQRLIQYLMKEFNLQVNLLLESIASTRRQPQSCE
jgi:hypothetical protein|tara:strand:- start:722 stop:940 length:219 start_codon:yes stop_codon:yes gene_type:complete